MVKSVLTSIGGVDLYAILSLGLFMTFFIGVLLWVMELRSAHLEHMQSLPLELNPDHSGDQNHVA